MKDKIGIILYYIFAIAGVGLGGYVGGWLMFIKPILMCCAAFDTGALTGMMIGTTILKCVFAGGVAGLIIYGMCLLGVIIMHLLED